MSVLNGLIDITGRLTTISCCLLMFIRTVVNITGNNFYSYMDLVMTHYGILIHPFSFLHGLARILVKDLIWTNLSEYLLSPNFLNLPIKALENIIMIYHGGNVMHVFIYWMLEILGKMLKRYLFVNWSTFYSLARSIYRIDVNTFDKYKMIIAISLSLFIYYLPSRMRLLLPHMEYENCRYMRDKLVSTKYYPLRAAPKIAMLSTGVDLNLYSFAYTCSILYIEIMIEVFPLNDLWMGCDLRHARWGKLPAGSRTKNRLREVFWIIYVINLILVAIIIIALPEDIRHLLFVINSIFKTADNLSILSYNISRGDLVRRLRDEDKPGLWNAFACKLAFDF